MSRLSRRRVLSGAGAAVLVVGGGYTAYRLQADEEEEWTAEPEPIPDDAPRELEPILMEIAQYQKYRLERFNERMKESGFRLPFDPRSLQNGVTRRDERSWERTYIVHTGIETNPDSAYDDVAERLDLPRGEEEAEIVLGGGIATVVDPILYIPIAGQDGDQHYDPRHYESFEDYLGGIDCTVSDHAGNEVTASIPTDAVTELWESVANTEKGESFDDIYRYVRENMTVTTRNSLG